MPDAIILCGGAGTRLRSVTGDSPKSMAPVAGRPFLELLLGQLQRHGFQRVVLAAGFRAGVISSALGTSAFGMQLVYAVETSPLGTGGAIRNAAGFIASDSALIMNGDSYTDVDLSAVVSEHLRANADLTMLVVPADGRSDTGSVLVGPGGSVARFAEKEAPGAARSCNNAGIYMASRDLLMNIPPGTPVSLEKELFPRWIDAGKNVHALIHSGHCVDIGTPDRYQAAQQALAGVAPAPPPSIPVESREES